MPSPTILMVILFHDLLSQNNPRLIYIKIKIVLLSQSLSFSLTAINLNNDELFLIPSNPNNKKHKKKTCKKLVSD